jgi:LNR domain
MNAKTRTYPSSTHETTTAPQRRRLAALLMGSLAALALIASAGAIESNPAPSAPAPLPTGARLESATGVVIGTLSGRTTSFDGSATTMGAYGVISARGYFADVLPSGGLGQVITLVYGSDDCSGAAAIELSSIMGGPLPVPGYVFAFGDPRQVFNVPAGATARMLAIGSMRQRTAAGYVCERHQAQGRVYPVQANRVDVSGFVDNYATPFAVHIPRADRSAVSTATRPARPKDQTGAGALMPSGSPQCAPGCYSAYIGDGICERECATSLCAFDGGDCKTDFVERAKTHEASLCAPACESANLGDGFCDKDCNVSKCEFDHGDCTNP